MPLLRKAVAVSCFAAVVAVCGTAHAAPGVDLVAQLHAQGTVALFRSTDESGCVTTAVFVVANADTERLLPSPSTRTAQVAVVISQFDLCRLVPLLTGNGVSEDATVVVSPSLREATVSAVVPVLNLSNGQLVDVFVDLSFVSNSILVADDGDELNLDVAGFIIDTAFDHTFRYATAIGSVMTLDGELTPEPSEEAMIEHVRAGTVVIAHP